MMLQELNSCILLNSGIKIVFMVFQEKLTVYRSLTASQTEIFQDRSKQTVPTIEIKYISYWIIDIAKIFFLVVSVYYWIHNFYRKIVHEFSLGHMI